MNGDVNPTRCTSVIQSDYKYMNIIPKKRPQEGYLNENSDDDVLSPHHSRQVSFVQEINDKVMHSCE